MAEAVAGADEGAAGEQYRMPARPGSHVAYARGADLIVEWYDFGKQAPYESANLLIFAPASQARLAQLLGADGTPCARALSKAVAARFDSYFEVWRYAEAHDLPFRTETDFWP